MKMKMSRVSQESRVKSQFLAAVLVAVFSIVGFNGTAHAATQTINLPRNQVVDSTSYYIGPNSGSSWLDGGVTYLGGNSNENLVAPNDNDGEARLRGWSFDFSAVCSAANAKSLTVTSNASGGDVLDSSDESVVTNLGIAGESALPVISRGYGSDLSTAFGPGYENATGFGDVSGNYDFLTTPGGIDVVITYDISTLSVLQLNDLVSTWGVLMGDISQNSPVVTPPVASLVFDDTNCANTNSPPAATSTTVKVPAINRAGMVVVSGFQMNAQDLDGDTLNYSISSGNPDGYFAINPATGDIITTRDNIPAGTYRLTIFISDGNGGTVSVEATIVISNNVLAMLPKTGDSTSAIALFAISLIGVSVFLSRKSFRTQR